MINHVLWTLALLACLIVSAASNAETGARTCSNTIDMTVITDGSDIRTVLKKCADLDEMVPERRQTRKQNRF